MNEKDLNIKYIQYKTKLIDNDELIPIILDMMQESYKAGLCQSEFDNTMGLIEENQELKKQLEKLDKKLFLTKNELDMREKSIDNKLNQQKEFIKYLEDDLKEKYRDMGYRHNIFREILDKYKEIIGGKHE